MARNQSTPEETSLSDSFEPQRVLLSPSVRDYNCVIGRHVTTIGSSTRRDVVSPTIAAASTNKDMIGRSDSMLVPKLVGDFAIAAVVTAAVAPALTVVDKALVERSAVSHTLLQSAKQSVMGMIQHPVAYFRSPTFLWMWATYFSTYATANSLRTLIEHQDNQKAKICAAQEDFLEERKTSTPSIAAPSSTMTLFVGTTIVNSSASLIKDRAYAKLFGNAVSTSVPKMSYGLWIARDCTVVGSSFVLPPIVAQGIQENILPSLCSDQALKLAQIVTPAAAQFVAGPLHFVGLDWFNRPTNVSLLERASFVQKGFAEVVAARIARIMPGYGLAGVWNQDLRNSWRQHVMNHCAANDDNHQWWQMDTVWPVYTEAKNIANCVGMLGIISSPSPSPKQPPVVLATTSTVNGDSRS